MQANVVVLVVSAFLIGAPALSWALPPRAAVGAKRCLCTCQSDVGEKTLEWDKGVTCNSGGKACKYTFDNGKTWQQGQLNNCSDCTYETSGWNCKPAAMKTQSPLQPGVTLQPKSPAQPKPSLPTAPKDGTAR